MRFTDSSFQNDNLKMYHPFLKSLHIMYVPIILGTARLGRESEKVAKFMLQELKESDLESEILDVRNYRLDATDRTGSQVEAKAFASMITKADAIIVVSPEYNHGYPGELKMTLDMLYSEYFKKPVGFCGVSNGILGGVRAVEQLRLVAIELHMVPIREAIYFSMVESLFDEEGEIKDKSYYERVQTFLNELVWYAEKLRS